MNSWAFIEIGNLSPLPVRQKIWECEYVSFISDPKKAPAPVPILPQILHNINVNTQEHTQLVTKYSVIHALYQQYSSHTFN